MGTVNLPPPNQPQQNNTGSRTIAEALAQQESHQLDELETLVARAMENVAGRAAGQGIEVVQSLLAEQLRAHLPVDSPSNKAWLRERARLIVNAQQD